MSQELENLLSQKFIARPDVKAVQFSNGAWAPHQSYNAATGKYDGPRIPWSRADLQSHLAGHCTFGHYLLGTDSTCKLFAFDIDLNKTGNLPRSEWFSDEQPPLEEEPDLRAAWLNRAHPARSYMKLQFKEMAHKLLNLIMEELKIPCAAAYSGAKGVHVYGFLERGPASVAREAISIILDPTYGFKAVRGENFFEHADYPNLSIEVFPKQASLEGKDLGNLMRLPLGKNLKAPKEPTFFIDMTSPMAELRPLDPIQALTQENPWETR